MSRQKITIIGIGRLGLVTALVLDVHGGYDVVGVDTVVSYVQTINDKTLDSPEPRVNELLQQSEHFVATTSLVDGLNHSTHAHILVPTPTSTGPDGPAYDTTILDSVLRQINELRVQNAHLVIGCTVHPGYTEHAKLNLLRDCPGTTLSYNPEFIQQGNIVHGFLFPDFVLIGADTQEAAEPIEEVYRRVCPKSPRAVMTPTEAEIAKLSVNCFVTTKIAYANYVGDLVRAMGGRPQVVLDAIATDTRVGRKCLGYGLGFGGPCFPRDNRALGSAARQQGIPSMISDATDQSNAHHSEYLTHVLPLQGSTVEFIGIGYKDPCPVPILEESQALEIAKHVRRQGVNVVLTDQKHLIDEARRLFGDTFQYRIVDQAHATPQRIVVDGKGMDYQGRSL